MVIGLYVVGVLSLMIGGYGIYSGIMADTAVAGTANFELMHIQSANLLLGCAFLIIAAITLSSGAIIEAVRKRRAD